MKMGKRELLAHFDAKARCVNIGKGSPLYGWRVELSSGEIMPKRLTPAGAWQSAYGTLYGRRQAMQGAWASIYAHRGYSPAAEFATPITAQGIDARQGHDPKGHGAKHESPMAKPCAHPSAPES